VQPDTSVRGCICASCGLIQWGRGSTGVPPPANGRAMPEAGRVYLAGACGWKDRLSVGDRKVGTDRVAADRLGHRAGLSRAAIDAHRATETAADLEGGFDDGVAREARRDRLEIGHSPGRAAAGQENPGWGTGVLAQTSKGEKLDRPDNI